MKELKEDLIPPLNLDLCLQLDYEDQLVLRLQGMGAVTVGEEESEELMMDAAMEEPEEDLIPLLNLDMLLQLDYEGQLGIRLQGMGAVTVGGEEDVEKLELVLLVKVDTKEPKLVMLEEGDDIQVPELVMEELLILQLDSEDKMTHTGEQQDVERGQQAICFLQLLSKCLKLTLIMIITGFLLHLMTIKSYVNELLGVIILDYKAHATVNYLIPFVIFSNNSSNIDLCQFVEDVNKFSRQKRGGQHPGPTGTPTNVCVLCSSGAICLGSACMGKKTQMSTIAMEGTEVSRPSSSSTIPGLVIASDR